MEPTVRTATPEDAAAIAEIHVEGWREAYRDHLPEDLLASLSTASREMTWREQLVDLAPRSAIFVAEADDIVGFSACGVYREDDLGEIDAGELYALYVEPERWRQGIGTALLRRTVQHFREESFDLAALWVLASNEPARDFYEKAGFLPDGTEKTDVYKGFELDEVRYRGAVD